MPLEFSTSPALVLSLALAAGIVSQILARHLRIPGIVVLLAVGVALGPEVLGIIDPGALGHSMHDVVGFAVAVILFEGGLNLNVSRLRRESLPIRRLLTLGAGTTLAGAALTSRLLLGWNWNLAILFGSLVIVTGPTVITPLLRRIRVERTLETILEAEGVFIDAIGAILAIVFLEVVVQGPTRETLTQGILSPPMRLGAGALLGLAGGGILTFLLRVKHLVPEDFQNTVSLALAVALFHLSNLWVPETGISAVIVAGLLVGNTTAAPRLRDLRDFKEQLTVLLIGLLFVLLAADVALEDLRALGWAGVLVVLTLMLLIRPLSVVLSTHGSDLDRPQKAFLSWVAPRGIVAAAIGSLFADRLADSGVPGGDELKALVFLVIAGTVVLQGASASFLAGWLGLRRPMNQGFAILGTNTFARLFARRLEAHGYEVVMMDANQDSTEKAQAEGLYVVFGNALADRAMLSAQLESRRGIIGLLANPAQNLLFAQTGREDGGAPRAWVAVQRGPGAPGIEAVTETGAHLLFGEAQDLELWSVRLRRGLAHLETWGWVKTVDGSAGSDWQIPREYRNQLLPFLLRRGGELHLIDETTRLKERDHVEWLVLEEAAESAHQHLRESGWTPVGEGPEDGGGRSDTNQEATQIPYTRYRVFAPRTSMSYS
jgi:NhaP-type Na+/H+ or K+/H+ antiporter